MNYKEWCIEQHKNTLSRFVTVTALSETRIFGYRKLERNN